MAFLFAETRSITEPAGALSVAGMKKYLSQLPAATSTGTAAGTSPARDTYVAVTSGANMNFDRLRFVAERAELGEKREALLTLKVPETPGTFVKLNNVVYPRSITEFAYRYGDTKVA